MGIQKNPKLSIFNFTPNLYTDDDLYNAKIDFLDQLYYIFKNCTIILYIFKNCTALEGDISYLIDRHEIIVTSHNYYRPKLSTLFRSLI